MSDGTRIAVETPAYQGIDLLLGADKKATAKPVRGYAITVPDNGIDCEMYTDMAQADAALVRLRGLSKWPDSVICRPAWIHIEGNRTFWSPR
jgi:hypothetical protein